MRGAGRRDLAVMTPSAIHQHLRRALARRRVAANGFALSLLAVAASGSMLRRPRSDFR